MPAPALDPDVRAILRGGDGPALGRAFEDARPAAERRALGTHHTPARIVVATLGPLVLDELWRECEAATGDRARLGALARRLGELRFLDPACGCGDFLVVAYGELRRLELAVIRHLLPLEGRASARVTLTQFRGIELVPAPARLAAVALRRAEQRANAELARALGDRAPAPAPPAVPRIRRGDALALDWHALGRCDYVVGNPPFVAKGHRTAAQAAALRRVFGGAPGHGELDYAAAWLELAARYVRGRPAEAAFVITSSLAQGEQVPALWPRLLERGMRIDFAHRPFAWHAGRGRAAAAVSVAIVGFSDGGRRAEKLLYDRGGRARRVARINPYLAAGPDVIVRPRRRPLARVPPIRFGSMPNDGGHLVLDGEERAAILAGDPVAARYVRELVGARALMDGRRRWCLWLLGADPADLEASATLRARVEAVRRHRSASARATTRRLAATPALFGEIRQPTARYLCVPRHGSAQRRCAPMAFAGPEAIAHDSTLTIAGASVHLFGLLQSAMFTAWLHAVGGRIKGDPRISAELVYNTFPWPPAAGAGVTRAARGVLAARAANPLHSLERLYDPRTMPPALARAHDALDAAVDALYGHGPFDEGSRLALLLERYSAMAGAGGREGGAATG